MSVSIKAHLHRQSAREKLVHTMNKILRTIDPKAKKLCIKTTKNSMSHYIKLIDCMTFLRSDSLHIAHLNVNDIISIGYKPKERDSLIYIDVK